MVQQLAGDVNTAASGVHQKVFAAADDDDDDDDDCLLVLCRLVWWFSGLLSCSTNLRLMDLLLQIPNYFLSRLT